MKSKQLSRTTIAIGMFSFLGTAVCIANDNLFLPGDAFFPTLLTKDGIAKMRTTKSGDRTFEYIATDVEGGAMCGYAGYANATIPSVDDAFAENLDRVYSKILSLRGRNLIERTENGKTTITENGGMRVLFYPSDFDFQVHRIGLKYNENWVVESKKFGHEKEHISYSSLINQAEAVAISWRDALDVKGLQAKLPDVALEPTPRMDVPVIVSEPVRAYVLGFGSLENFFDPDGDALLTLYIVDSKGVEEWQHQLGEWKLGVSWKINVGKVSG
jgi:hypothetical protein